jgi:LmbE family N-acetylglucosaminyl deacetylase
MGEVRRKETIMAMGSLGVPAQDIIFLGYPDFGTMEILTKYWGETKPFRSMLTKVSKVPYPECLSPNAPYVGESILKDLKSVLLDFKPNKIFVSHSADSNRDHRALYLFLQIALWDLDTEIKPALIFPYIIHVVGWPKPRGYHPDLELIPADKFKESGIFWQRFVLTEGEIKAKRNAIKYYKSQIKYNPAYLFTFCRKNELYGDFPTVELKKQKADVLDWQTLKAFGEEEKSTEVEVKNQIDRISALAYACSRDDLFVKLTLTRKRAGVSIFLLGYSKKTDFAQMPKMNLFVDKYGLHIKDKTKTLFIKDVELKYLDDTIMIKVPLTALGNPDFILSWVKARTNDLSVDETSWRVLELK